MPSNRRWLRACSRPGTHGTGPRRGQLLAGDATIPKAPSKAEQATTEDTATGWVLSHRVDLAARVYYENAEKAKRAARGTKWLFASGREDGYWRRVILAFCHVAGCAYEDEAAVAVRTFTRMSSHLPGCLGVLYNGAFRGTHPDALARQGLLVINKQHGATAPRAYEMLRYGRCRHDLWCQDGQIAERVGLDDGTSYASPAATVPTPCVSPWPSPPLPPTAPARTAQPASAAPAIPSATSTAPSTSSRSRRAPLPTSCSTPTAATPSPSTTSSTRACGTAGDRESH